MNILQVLPELNVGGVETGTVDLAKYLVRSGHKAVVVSNGGELVKELEAVGATHYRLAVHKKSILSVIRLIPELAAIIKKEKIDIVHARSRVPAWIAYFASRRVSAVFITTCHGFYKKHIFSNVMGYGKRVIVLSNVIARHMIEDFHVPHERIRLIPRSVDLEKFKYRPPDKIRPKEFNVGIIGRITPIKGHLHFIKAMAKVFRVVPTIKIWIVGDAPASKEAYKEQIHVLVRRLGLGPYTEFLGTQRNIPEILAHLDLLVLATTTHEAFGRVIIEAQASGVPVVATEVGGVVDIIENEKTGLLVPPADPKAMAEAIVRYFKDPQLSQIIAENALKKVQEKYNVELMVKNTLEVYKDALKYFKILIIKFSSLGDIILSTAALRAIREKFRDNYKISFLVGEESKDVLLRSPHIDELIVADLKNKDKGLKGLLSLAANLRKRNFDIIIDLQNNRSSHLLSFLTSCLNRYGYDNRKLGFLLNHRIKDEKPAMDPVTHQFRILKMLGIDLPPHQLSKKDHQEPNWCGGLEEVRLELWPSQEDEQYIDDLLNSHWLSAKQRIVGINISASSRWLTKNWPLIHIARLSEELDSKDMRVLITGTSKEIPAAEKLMGMARNTKIINACGKTTVNQLACLIRKCAVFISSDSSPLHIAAAVGTPFVALFGPTDPLRHLPLAKNCVVINKGLTCSPCYKSKCKSMECMELITPQEVIEAIGKLLMSR